MNVFNQAHIAATYDDYYQTPFGKQVDEAEKLIIKRLIKNIMPQPLLEPGCGTGHWTEFFIQNGFNVTGIDASENMLTIAKSKNLPAAFIHASAEKIPFEDESFGFITSITMLEFVKDQNKVFQEMYRLLKPSGYILLGCLNQDSVLGKNKSNSQTFKNANFFTTEELTKKLEVFGTPVIEKGVYIQDDYTLSSTKTQSGASFIAALVQKIK